MNGRPNARDARDPAPGGDRGPLPLTSAVICSRDGHGRVPRALGSVLRQDTRGFEVIVVDDGSQPALDIPSESAGLSDVELRVIRTEPCGVGAARAAGFEAASGDLIAFCDDDDEWHPEHLRILRNYLLHHRDVALVYADSEWLYPDGSREVPYSVDFDAFKLSGDNFIFPSDAMFRVAGAREAGGFDPALDAYEDWDLWLRMSQRRKLRHLPIVLSTTHWHDGCVTSTQRWGHAWQRVYDVHQRRRRSNVRRRQPDFTPDTWREGRRQLMWYSPLDRSGYGTVGRNLVLALHSLGVEVSIPAVGPLGVQPPENIEQLCTRAVERDRLAFYYHWRVTPGELGCERTIVYHMWESTHVPQRCVRQINARACLLYVPCGQNAESYRKAGVRVPIRVLHHGVDPAAFPELRRARRSSFTFGTFGELTVRKGVDVLVRAFRDEFGAGDDARLILKAFDKERRPHNVDDPRITFVSGSCDSRRLLELLAEMDAFVLPSRGEGFGLCGLEAMATGLPLIATNWGGPVEYLDPADSFPLAYDLVNADGAQSFGLRFYGRWAEPSYEHLRSLMRWLYEHPEAAAEKGRQAAARVRKHWTWQRAAVQVRGELDDIVASWPRAA